MTKENKEGILLQGISGLPLQIPWEILDAQKEIGVIQVVLWINLLAFAQKGRRMTVDSLSAVTGLERTEIEQGLATLADRGWINDEGLEIKLCIPQREEMGASLSSPGFLDEEQAGFEWLIDFWTNRVGDLTPDEMRKLLYWVEHKGMAADVIAVAIEEMCSAIDRPNFAYLEGVLRNWANEGVSTYDQLLERSHLTKVLPHNTGGAGISPQAESKWKEVFPDEFE